MIRIDIPGLDTLEIKHLVCDYTGTLSEDGELCPGIKERFTTLAENLEIHVLTADTFGKAREALADLPCTVHVFKKSPLDLQKDAYVRKLGPEHVMALGNGKNDRAMIRTARVGVVVCLKEGCALEAATAGDVLVTSACDALDLLLQPKRLTATLRN